MGPVFAVFDSCTVVGEYAMTVWLHTPGVDLQGPSPRFHAVDTPLTQGAVDAIDGPVRSFASPALVVVALASGCAAHVMIDPPPPVTAPLEMRSAYYEQHAPEPPERGELVARTRLGESHAKFTRKDLHLHNGARVAWVEDMRPLVDDKSDAARAIDTAVEARERANLITGGGVAVAVVGAGGGGGLISSYLLQQGLSQQGKTLDPVFAAGAALAVVGVLGGGALVTWGMAVRNDEDDARTLAFKQMPQAMREKLALPVEELPVE